MQLQSSYHSPVKRDSTQQVYHVGGSANRKSIFVYDIASNMFETDTTQQLTRGRRQSGCHILDSSSGGKLVVAGGLDVHIADQLYTVEVLDLDGGPAGGATIEGPTMPVLEEPYSFVHVDGAFLAIGASANVIYEYDAAGGNGWKHLSRDYDYAGGGVNWKNVLAIPADDLLDACEAAAN